MAASLSNHHRFLGANSIRILIKSAMLCLLVSVDTSNAVDLASDAYKSVLAGSPVNELEFLQLTQVGAELELDPDQYQMELIEPKKTADMPQTATIP